MPTVIALDISLSMQRVIPGRESRDNNSLTYLNLATKAISQLLEHLAQNKMEFVSLVTYSTTVEIKADFTRDYDQIRQALKKIETGDKACLLSLFKSASTMFNNWTQNCAQLVVFTDCGIGFGSTSLTNFMSTYAGKDLDAELSWLPALKPIKIHFICMGLHSDIYYTRALTVFEQLVEFLGLKAQLFTPKQRETTDTTDGDSSKSQGSGSQNSSHSSHKSELGRSRMFELIEKLCENHFKPLEVTLKVGGYFRLESQVLLWPPPAIYKASGGLTQVERSIATKLEVCGFLSLSEIGSPSSLSRHLVLPKIEREKPSRRSSEKSSSLSKSSGASSSNAKALDPNGPNYEFEKLEQDIRDFYNKESKDSDDVVIIDDNEANKSGQSSTSVGGTSETQKESLCVLLHTALKIENIAAVVRLGDDWFGFLYPYADSKKKSNLVLNILTPGCTIPWLGEFEMLGFAEDLTPGEATTFPVKSEKRSYSQNCVVWIRQVSLQSDVQKVLRHAKKMPEKTQHFYKELNRIRRAALSIGFIELLEAMAVLFEKEAISLTPNASPDCIRQLNYAAVELRKPSNRDLKVTIVPAQI